MKRPLCFIALCLAAPLASATTLGGIAFSPCTLAAPGASAPVAAQCARVEVPEDRTAPDARRISLALAWVAAATADPAADPVFLLAGGPGQSARDSYPAVAGAFSDILKRRHVILLDQRGTGESNRLACAQDEAESTDISIEHAVEQTRTCLTSLSAVADVRHYTTGDAVADLEAVRLALGVPAINLIGVSYGTRVAQQYMKAYPEAVRSAVLDGVVPNSLVLGQEHARNLEDSLARQFAACTQLPACREALGDPMDTFRALAAELAEQPRQVHFRDATTGAPAQGEFGRPALSGLLRMYAYQPAIAATLPLLLSDLAQGHSDAAMAQARMLISSMDEAMAQGMGLSVTCSEDADELVPDPADADTVMGDEFVRYIQAQCAVWPHGSRAADFREPARGDTPVLLLSGELDPVTPPRYGEEVAAHLPRSRHLVLRGQGHNVIGTGCTPKLVARFIENIDAAALDAECLDRLAATPPFSGRYGWEP